MSTDLSRILQQINLNCVRIKFAAVIRLQARASRAIFLLYYTQRVALGYSCDDFVYVVFNVSRKFF